VTSPILETERLSFRLMGDADEADLERLDGDPDVRAFFPGGTSKRPTSRERIAHNLASYAQHGVCDFVVQDRATGAFMGRAGLHRMDDGEVEVGYLFLKQHWGQGFATEALRSLLGRAREALPAHALPSRRILAFAPTHHHASLRVMERCGMRRFKTDRYQGTECVFYEVAL
jgi:[ribosomal protein S5]-alanine N-acetyltransferase